jgi:DNA (cytosine-5)-methyltransferase 1
VFIIGNFRGEPRPKIFPIKGNDRENIEPNKETIIYWKNSKEKWVKEDKFISPTLKTHSDLVKRPLVALYDVSYPSRVRKYTEFCPTIKNYGGGGNLTPIVNAIRKLTPTECERLQGFPDGWTEGVSDNQRYKCLGNAVTVNVVEYIVKNLFQK